MPKLEIAVTSRQDAVQADAGGADSVEVCENLSVGGLTPSLEMVRQICDAVAIEVNVIVRPHARSFIYSIDEIAQILRDVDSIAQLRVENVVFGAHRLGRGLNTDLIAQVQQASRESTVTVHRALDESLEPERALEELAALGIGRILTSGPAASAWEGRHSLARWIRNYGRHFDFVVAGGLQLVHFPEMAAILNAPEYHFGSAARGLDGVEAEKVRQLRTAILPRS